MTLSAIPSSGSVLSSAPLFSGKSDISKSTGPSFGTIVRKKVADTATSTTDPLAQLVNLLQSGTPINTIVDTIVKTVSDRVKSATSQTERLRTALAPPGTAPPGQPAAEQVAALVRKLQTLLKNVTGGTETVPAGQQNDISGSILDAAATAKEIPAQAQTAPTSTSVDIGSLVHSILERAAAQLQSAPVVAASVPAPQPPVAPDASSSAPVVSVAPETQVPDLLSRMILRASNGSVRSDAAPVARPSSSPTTVGASATFARLIATAERAMQNGGGSSRDGFGSDPTRDPGKTAVGGGKTDVSDLAAFTVPGSADASADPAKATSAGLTPYTTVDPEAILSQIVKGISIKPDADGVHQMQLHLQPAHLGNVTLDLRVDGSSVTANVVAQSADVRDALVNNQHHLARAFAESGLELTGFSVNVSGGDARGFQQGQHNSQGFGRRYVVHETAGSDDADASVSSSASPSRANGSLDLLDHLV